MNLFKYIFNFIFPNYKKFPYVLKGFIRYINDYLKLKNQLKQEGIECHIRFDPFLFDSQVESGSIEKHYFLQDIWAARKIFNSKVDQHFDIGSRVDGFLSSTSVFTKVYEVDIRKSSLNIDSLEFIQSSITNLPFGDCTINSLSCLHVAEHIGLGRYGDNIDINGTKKAVEELQRTLAKNGNLFFSVPIGKDSIYFNAHRIFSVKTIQNLFYELIIVDFSFIDDEDKIHYNADLNLIPKLEYGCGLFHFKKN